MRRAVGVRAVIGLAVAGSTLLGISAPIARGYAAAPGYAVEISSIGGYGWGHQMVLAVPDLIVNNGAMYLPGASIQIYPGPAVAPIEKRTPKRSELYAAVRDLHAALVEPADGWGRAPVMDAPTTYIMVSTPAGVRSGAVYVPVMLTENDRQWFTPAQYEARVKLYNAMTILTGLNGSSSMYKPRTVELWQFEQGWRGDGEVLKLNARPTKTAVKGCYTLSVSSIPKGTVSNTRFQLRDGSVIEALLRPVLPGEKPCLRSVRR